MTFEEVIPEDTSLFRSENFVDTCVFCGQSMKEINGDAVDCINLGFENGPDLDILFPRDYPATFKNSSGLGRFVTSMNNLGYKFLVDTQNKQVAFEPALDGMSMSIEKGINKYTQDGDEKTFTWWECTAISGNGSVTPPTPSGPAPELIATVENIVLDLINEKESVSKRDIAAAITASCTDRAESKPLQSARDQALQNLINNAMIVLEGGVYKMA
jgi:hypothetical protein